MENRGQNVLLEALAIIIVHYHVPRAEKFMVTIIDIFISNMADELSLGPLNSPQGTADQAFLDAQVNAMLQEQADQGQQGVPLSRNSIDDEVNDVMEMIVADSSKDQYNGSNGRFLLWLYHQNDTRLLKPEIISNLSTAYARDLALGSCNKENHIREAALTSLKQAKCAETSPVYLDRLDFTEVSRFMVSQRKPDGSYHGKSTYENIRSSILYLFRKCSFRSSEDLTSAGKMKDLLSSLKRLIARDKQERGERLEAGKSPLPYPAYKFLCEQLLKSDDTNALFGHCFLTLEWSLMARADNVIKTHLDHIQWRDDCMVVFFAHTKSDQEGINMGEPWHIYCNSIEPAVCPVLALAKYVLSHPEVINIIVS